VRGLGRLYRSIYGNLLISEEAKKTFDLRSESPVKAKVLKINKNYLLSLCVDHIAADGISFDLFERELLCSYQKVLNGLPLSGSPDKGFFKFISKEIKQQKDEDNNLLYWKQQLGSAPISIKVDPGIKFTPVIANVFRFQFSGEPFLELLDFCKTFKYSTFNIIVACHLLLLAEAGASEEIVLSIPFSNRILAEEQCIIGNVFVPLHVRFSLIRNEPTSKFMLRIKETLLNAMFHRQYHYPSLSHFLFQETKKTNTRLNLTRECNLIVENEPRFPNTLFAQQIIHDRVKTHKTSFHVFGRQSDSMVSITITWDGTTWPISENDMVKKFQKVIRKIYNSNEPYMD
jgi:hypothetical protein